MPLSLLRSGHVENKEMPGGEMGKCKMQNDVSPFSTYIFTTWHEIWGIWICGKAKREMSRTEVMKKNYLSL
jgi:hypothetical protein